MIAALFRSMGGFWQNSVRPWIFLTLWPQGRDFMARWLDKVDEDFPYHLMSMLVGLVIVRMADLIIRLVF